MGYVDLKTMPRSLVTSPPDNASFTGERRTRRPKFAGRRGIDPASTKTISATQTSVTLRVGGASAFGDNAIALEIKGSRVVGGGSRGAIGHRESKADGCAGWG